MQIQDVRNGCLGCRAREAFTVQQHPTLLCRWSPDSMDACNWAAEPHRMQLCVSADMAVYWFYTIIYIYIYTWLYMIIHDYTWLYDSDIIKYHNLIILLYLNDPEWQCARPSNMKQHVILKTSEDSEKSWGAARAKVLSTGTKGFGSPSPSWNPGDCDSKPHPPGRARVPRDASGPRDLPLPNILGLWEYPGNPFFNVQQHFYAFLSPTERGWMSHQSKKWLFRYSCQAFSERKDASFLQIVKIYDLFGFGRDFLRFLFDSIRLLLRWGHSPLALDSTIPQKGRSLCTLTTGPNTP